MQQQIVVDALEVELAIAEYLAQADEQVEVQAAARRHNALPFWRDVGGCLFLRPDGTIWSMGWDTPELFEPVSDFKPDRGVVHAARGYASKEFPSISGLEPQRGPAAVPCLTCDGKGNIAGVTDKHPNVKCSCGGLGWLPEPSSANTEP